MALDISSFRSIAPRSPDRLVYASGEKVKSAEFPLLTKYYLNAG